MSEVMTVTPGDSWPPGQTVTYKFTFPSDLSAVALRLVVREDPQWSDADRPGRFLTEADRSKFAADVSDWEIAAESTTTTTPGAGYQGALTITTPTGPGFRRYIVACYRTDTTPDQEVVPPAWLSVRPDLR